MDGSALRRLCAVLGIGLLALGTLHAQGADPVHILTAVRIEGGDEDDRRFASAAFGLKQGQTVDESGFQQALAAVRLVDRYRSVEGMLAADGSVILRLDPLPTLASWKWEGDAVPKSVRKTILPELRKGQRLGSQLLIRLAGLAEQRLREAGYPEARITLTSEQAGQLLRLGLSLGAPALIRAVQLVGDPSPYTRETLLKVAGLRPGTSFWTPTVVRDAQRRLRQRLVKDHRLEGSIKLEPAIEPGVMRLEVRPGPKVTLRGRGLNVLAPLWGQPRLAEFVPLARAER